MAFTNTGFETEDAAALGYPEDWTPAFVFAGVAAAGYDDGSPAAAGSDPREDFGGGWSSNEDYLFVYADPVDVGELGAAIYDSALTFPEGVEDFEEGWSSNESYLTSFLSGAAGQYDAIAYLLGTKGGPYALTGGEVLSLTSDIGGPASSDAVAGSEAVVTGSGGAFDFSLGTGPRRVRLGVDGLTPFVFDLDGAGTLATTIRNVINVQSNIEYGVDICRLNGGQLEFFGQVEGTDGEVLLENVDGGREISKLNEPLLLSHGQTLFVKVDGGGAQTVTLDTADFVSIGAATNAELAFVLDRDLTGARGYVIDLGAVDRVAIETENFLGTGDASSIEVTGGTMTPTFYSVQKTRSPIQKLGFTQPATPVPGTGNVGDLSAVTLSEIAVIVNGSAALDAISAAMSDAGSPGGRVYSETTDGTGTIQANASALATELVLATGVPTTATGFAQEGVEDFEEVWFDVENFLEDWVDVVAGPGEDAADFDSGTPEPVEDFEEEWDSNESYSFTMGSTTAASYDAGGTPEPVEDFEEVKGEFGVVANVALDQLTKTSHGLSNGQTVTFRNEGGVLPAGINVSYTYFVISVTANTFQISATSGGSAIDITDVGIGTHFAIPDPTVFWTRVMTTL